jgi:hypothetical protein
MQRADTWIEGPPRRISARQLLPTLSPETCSACRSLSKETLAQQRLPLEKVSDQTRANLVQSWGQLVATKAQVLSAQAQVTASEIALNGVREEAKAGQRTLSSFETGPSFLEHKMDLEKQTTILPPAEPSTSSNSIDKPKQVSLFDAVRRRPFATSLADSGGANPARRSASNHSRNVTIFERFDVTFGQTIQ